MGWQRRCTAWLVVGAAALWLSAPALADEMRSQLEAANERLVAHEAHEHASEASSEIAQMRLMISEAQGQLAAGDRLSARGTLLRVNAVQRLIESILQRATFERLAHERESDMLQTVEETSELQLQLEVATQRRQALQDEVRAIVDRLEQN